MAPGGGSLDGDIVAAVEITRLTVNEKEVTNVQLSPYQLIGSAG